MVRIDEIYDAELEYVQSANTLFHFMKDEQYLLDIIDRKGVVPRYCEESLDYLDLDYSSIYVLQKCFCDIPLHKLMTNFPVYSKGDDLEKLSADELSELQHNNTHTDYYGKYGIAFSKKWCEKQNFQPVHYLNSISSYVKEYSDVFKYAMEKEDIEDVIAADIMNRIAYIKPLSGMMSRIVEEQTIELYKNFHDENEWRYIPNIEALNECKLDKLIFGKSISKHINEINKNIEKSEYSHIWLKFDYEDIKYLIVPDNQSRLDLINCIMSLSDEKYNDKRNIDMQKYLLISKILVLDEIGKDW